MWDSMILFLFYFIINHLWYLPVFTSWNVTTYCDYWWCSVQFLKIQWLFKQCYTVVSDQLLLPVRITQRVPIKCHQMVVNFKSSGGATMLQVEKSWKNTIHKQCYTFSSWIVVPCAADRVSIVLRFSHPLCSHRKKKMCC